DLGEALLASLGPAIFDRDGAILDPSELAEPLHKGGDPLALDRMSGWTQVPDGRRVSRPLRARRERPRGRAGKQRDELASLHSITSSAPYRFGEKRVATLTLLTFTAPSRPRSCGVDITKFSDRRFPKFANALCRYSDVSVHLHRYFIWHAAKSYVERGNTFGPISHKGSP